MTGLWADERAERLITVLLKARLKPVKSLQFGSVPFLCCMSANVHTLKLKRL